MHIHTFMTSALPGTEFHYTTHGWTLISAVLEKVSSKQFLQYMDDHIFKPLGMSATGGEFHQPIVYNRARLISLSHERGSSLLGTGDTLFVLVGHSFKTSGGNHSKSEGGEADKY